MPSLRALALKPWAGRLGDMELGGVGRPGPALSLAVEAFGASSEVTPLGLGMLTASTLRERAWEMLETEEAILSEDGEVDVLYSLLAYACHGRDADHGDCQEDVADNARIREVSLTRKYALLKS